MFGYDLGRLHPPTGCILCGPARDILLPSSRFSGSPRKQMASILELSLIGCAFSWSPSSPGPFIPCCHSRACAHVPLPPCTVQALVLLSSIFKPVTGSSHCLPALATHKELFTHLESRRTPAAMVSIVAPFQMEKPGLYPCAPLSEVPGGSNKPSVLDASWGPPLGAGCDWLCEGGPVPRG